MQPTEWEAVKALFHEAIELAPENRAAFVARATGHDAALRAQLESLLDAHENSDDFL